MGLALTWTIIFVALALFFMTNITVFGVSLAAIALFCIKWAVILAVIGFILKAIAD